MVSVAGAPGGALAAPGDALAARNDAPGILDVLGVLGLEDKRCSCITECILYLSMYFWCLVSVALEIRFHRSKMGFVVLCVCVCVYEKVCRGVCRCICVCM